MTELAVLQYDRLLAFRFSLLARCPRVSPRGVAPRLQRADGGRDATRFSLPASRSFPRQPISRDKEEIVCDGLPEALAAGGTGDKIDGQPDELLEAELELHKVHQARRPVELDQYIDVARSRLAPRHRAKQPQVFDVISAKGRMLTAQLIDDGDGGMSHSNSE